MLQVHEIGASCVAPAVGVNVTVALVTHWATPEDFIVAVMMPVPTSRASVYLLMPPESAFEKPGLPLSAPVNVPLTW